MTSAFAEEIAEQKDAALTFAARQQVGQQYPRIAVLQTDEFQIAPEPGASRRNRAGAMQKQQENWVFDACSRNGAARMTALTAGKRIFGILNDKDIL